MKYLVALFLLVSFTIPQISFASTESDYRDRLLEMVAELQALVRQLQASLVNNESKLEIPDEEFSSIILADDARVISHYRISSPKAVESISDTDEREFFARFYYIVPDEFDSRFKELVLFDERRETMDAFVETIPPYTSHDWRFGMTKDIFEYEADDSEVTALFIHEFAHVVGYDGGSESDILDSVECHEYFEWGCPPVGSYLDEFISTYWNDTILDDFVFYGSDLWTEREQQRMFVSSYAVTSPEEDFAESFVEFIVQPKSSGTTVKDKKTNFFYQYSELVDMREELRSRL